MASITVNLPSYAGSYLLSLGQRLKELGSDVPDVATGGTTVLTIDNAATGLVEFRVSSGPGNGKKRGK